jgi:hypothetical protein
MLWEKEKLALAEGKWGTYSRRIKLPSFFFFSLLHSSVPFSIFFF